MRNLRTKSRRSLAFTLVEALAVVTVVGVIMPVVIYGISMSQSAVAVVSQRAKALQIAGNEMNLVLAEGSWQSDQQGDVNEFHWTTHTQEWTDPTSTSLRELLVEVSWQNGARQRSVKLSTLVYNGGTTQ